MARFQRIVGQLLIPATVLLVPLWSFGKGSPAAAAAKPRAASPAPSPSVKPRPPAAAKPAKTDPAALAIVAGIQAFYDKSAGFSASFTQVVKKRGLKKGIKRKGKVWLVKGATRTDKDGKPVVDNGKMRWDYPDEEIFYFSDGEVLWSYERRERLAVKLPVKNSRLYQATSYLVGQGDLARDFDLELATSPLKGTKALKLLPREGTGVMQSLTLIVDERTFAVKASILVDPLGDSTSLFFKDAAYGEIDGKIFVWTPPKGVKVKTM